jgi:hypothetical protein
MATIIHVAVSTDLMTNPGVIDVPAIKHICLVGNNRPWVQGNQRYPHPEERPLGRVSKDERCMMSWFETRQEALLTMRTDRKPREIPPPC